MENILIRFQRRHGIYNVGEEASFSEAKCQQLVASGFAVYVNPALAKASTRRKLDEANTRLQAATAKLTDAQNEYRQAQDLSLALRAEYEAAVNYQHVRAGAQKTAATDAMQYAVYTSDDGTVHPHPVAEMEELVALGMVNGGDVEWPVGYTRVSVPEPDVAVEAAAEMEANLVAVDYSALPLHELKRIAESRGIQCRNMGKQQVISFLAEADAAELDHAKA